MNTKREELERSINIVYNNFESKLKEIVDTINDAERKECFNLLTDNKKED